MTLTPDWNISNPVTYARMRQSMLESGIQEGIVGANDLKAAQRGAGANMSVDIPTGAAWVQIDTGTRNGLGHVYNDATANVTVTASNATNPRIDQIILRWNDSSIPTGSGNTPTLEALTGTATAGATLDNRTGAAALPNDCLRLADILVPAASTSVTTANIRDRRPWARGANWSFIKSSGNTVGFAGFTTLDATNMLPRVECSGAPLVLTFGLTYAAPAGGSRSVRARVLLDGGATAIAERDVLVGASSNGSINLVEPYTPAAGSHTFTFQLDTQLADGTLYMGTGGNPVITAAIWEQVRPNASNT